MAFSQLVKVDVNLDSIAAVFDKKDREIKAIRVEMEDYRTIIVTKDFTINKLHDTINELMWYKKYYMHSKHVIGPRLIGRIEEMVKHE